MFYLILNSDYKENTPSIDIIASSNVKSDLELMTSFEPSDIISITNLKLNFDSKHDITNAYTNVLEPATIYIG